MEDSSPEVSSQLLKRKYDLHKQPEVEAASKRSRFRTGERVSQNPLDRIQNYLNRFREITDREDPAKREQGIDAIKRLLHRKYIVKPEDIPESYWDNQRRIIRERGQAADLTHVDFESLKRQNIEAIIADQQSSMDKWIDYLSSRDAPYPDALKYWTLRSVLSISEYDKNKKLYPQRSKGTTKPFPDLNREALAYVIDALNKKYTINGEKGVNEITDSRLETLLVAENFSKLYAYAIEKITPLGEQGLANITGQWVKYDQGSDHMQLVKSLQGYGTGWCTAGESTAQTQLQGGDFYVYYSNGSDGKPTIPRVAIRMESDDIAEVRGIAQEQNIDPYVSAIVEQKLEEFPDGKVYQKKVTHMKYLTEIDRKIKENTQLDSSELAFLYEIDGPIQGFGYSRDPRIEELREQRSIESDIPIVFDCNPSQIAHKIEEVNPDTKVYIGPLVPGIFTRLQANQIEHIYTSFPEGKIQKQQLEIGGKTKDQLIDEMLHEHIHIVHTAVDIMNSPDFSTKSEPNVLDIVRLKISDLGQFNRPITSNQLYTIIKQLGLDLCPVEVGPHLRLQSNSDRSVSIAMNPLIGSDGNPYVFSLGKVMDRLYLNAVYSFQYTYLSGVDPEIVFSFPTSEKALT